MYVKCMYEVDTSTLYVIILRTSYIGDYIRTRLFPFTANVMRSPALAVCGILTIILFTRMFFPLELGGTITVMKDVFCTILDRLLENCCI